MRKLGFILNPIAGMGGRVGLKGTDGKDALEEARQRGAVPWSPARAREALGRMAGMKDEIELLTCSALMGEDDSRLCGFLPSVVALVGEAPSPCDTYEAAQRMREEGVDLLLFAGGDGTARIICDAVGDTLVTLGIPAGVKIHSATFASTPARAGDLAQLYLSGRVRRVVEAEVMDTDEEEYRKGRLSTRLYGYLRIPFAESHVQRHKVASGTSEEYQRKAIAAEVCGLMSDDSFYLIGPGTTTQAILYELGLAGSLLGVDCVFERRLVGRDMSEEEIEEMTRGMKVKIVVSPIGGQGHLFGRGNQQMSPCIIGRAGRDNIIVVATKHKIHSLQGRPLLIDTGDAGCDSRLSGYWNVITGWRERIVYRCV